MKQNFNGIYSHLKFLILYNKKFSFLLYKIKN